MKYFKKCLFILIVLILNVMVINYIFSTTPEPEVNRTKASTSFLGDVNTDGMIDILDALLVARFYVGFQVNLFDSEAADVNCDGIVDIIDALILARYYVGLITEFPCPAETPTITPTPTPTPTQVPTLIQMIDTKHNEYSFIGNPVSAYILKGDLLYREYQYGVISAGYTIGGAKVVHGMIWVKYNLLGGPDSFLGLPITDELSANDGEGRFNHFEGGSIYWHPDNVNQEAFEMHGEILVKWRELGYEDFLGYPQTDERITPDGIGYYQIYQHGYIYWHPGSGAHTVYGMIFDKWGSMGWENSELGYPITDELTVSSDIYGRYSQFQHGAIYYHPTHGTYMMKGKIYLYWLDQGGTSSSYGYPVADPQYKSKPELQGDIWVTVYYWEQQFQNGILRTDIAPLVNNMNLRGQVERMGIGIRDQRPRNTCTIFAITFLLEYMYSSLFGEGYEDLSEEYLNHMENVANGYTDDGSMFHYVDNSYKIYGIIHEDHLPYDNSLVYNYDTYTVSTELRLLGMRMLYPGLKLKGVKVLRHPWDGGTEPMSYTYINRITEYLDNCIPVAIGYQTGPNTGHSVGVVGYEWDWNDPDSGYGYFLIKDHQSDALYDKGYWKMDFQYAIDHINDIYVFEGIE